MVGVLDRTRGSIMALVMEVNIGILRGEIAVPQKITAPGPRRLRRLLAVRPVLHQVYRICGVLLGNGSPTLSPG